MTTLASAIAEVAAALSDDHLAAVEAACVDQVSFDAAARAAVRAVVPGPHRDAVGPLLTAWQQEPNLPGSALALAIASLRAAGRVADHPDVKVVCTGPTSPAAPTRLTSEVVLELVANATRRVTLVSFSSYKVPVVMSALDAAVTCGVQVDLILESQEHLQHGGGAETFTGYRVFVWPADQRPHNARLHAKSVLVDDERVLLTSANLSAAAFNSSLELGVLIRGGGIARSIQQHLDALIAAGVLRRA